VAVGKRSVKNMNTRQAQPIGKVRSFAFPLPSLDLSTLEGYQEDITALRRFERPFILPSVFGGLLFLGPFIYLMIYRQPVYLLSLCLVGLLTFLGTMYVMFRSKPLSKASGRPMERYWNTSSSARGDEVIYVCHDSKTYFRRTFAEKGRKSAST
jgi:hypothetical protein